MRHYFIINPAAGKKSMAEVLKEQIAICFSDRSDKYDISVTTKPFEATELVQQYAMRHKNEQVRIYACGGDGTLNEVITGAYKFPNCAVGAIPIGSGNDFVKAYLPLMQSDFLAIERMVDGEIDAIDLLTIGEEGTEPRAGINITSVGFDAEIAAGMKRFKRLPFVSGSMAYNLSLFGKLFTSLKTKLKFIVDGKPLEDNDGDFLFTIAANGRWYGGGFKAAPIAELSDGLLDFIAIPSIPLYKITGLINVFRRGEHLQKLKFVKFLRCRTLQIITEKVTNVNIDGEIFRMKNPIISLLPKAIRIIVPKQLQTNGV